MLQRELEHRESVTGPEISCCVPAQYPELKPPALLIGMGRPLEDGIPPCQTTGQALSLLQHAPTGTLALQDCPSLLTWPGLS